MSLLKPASGGGYLKAGFLGFAGAGKTWTGIELAIGTRRYFGLKGPIAFFDSESGSDYVAARVQKETGQPLLVVKSRSLADLMSTAHECTAAGVSVLFVDSISHVWKEVCDSYLKQRIAKHRAQNRRNVSDKLEFQDWARLKGMWAQWPEWFVNSSMHCIVAGRAAFEYDFEKDDDGKKELIKSGVKMSTENNFAFEPSLLVEMSRSFAVDKRGELTDSRTVINRAIVVKDRFGVIDGKMCDDPTFDFFAPHVELLRAADHTPVATSQETQFSLDGEGRADWDRERDQREIAAEKVKAAFQLAGIDGQGAEDKKTRAEAMQKFWGTMSWKELSEKTPSGELMRGLAAFARAHDLMGDDEDDVDHLVAVPDTTDTDQPAKAS